MVSRRNALKIVAGATAAVATGGAAFLWLNTDEDAPPGEHPGSPEASTDGTASSPAPPPTGELASVEAEVGDDGFNLVLGSVRVSAPAGVAPAGTTISISTLSQHVPEGYEDFSEIVGQPVTIRLGAGLQPAQPITVVFDLAGWESVTADVTEDVPIALVSQSDGEEDYLLYTGRWERETHTLTAVVDHLSRFWPLRIDLKKIVTDFLYGLLNLQHPQPACAYQPLTIGDSTVNVRSITGGAFWPCVREEDGDLVLELHSNSVLPWTVITSPITSGSVSGEFIDASPAIGYVYQEMHRLFGMQRSIVMTGKTTRFRFDGSSRAPAIDVEVDRMFFVAGIAISVVAAMLERLQLRNLAKFLLDSIGALLCLVDTINTTYKETSQELAQNGFMTALSCVTEWLEDAAKTSGKFFLATITSVISLLVSGASGLAGVVMLFLSDAAGTSRFSVWIDRDSPSVSQPDPSTEQASRPGPTGASMPMLRGNAARTGEMPGPLPDMDRPVEAVWSISPDGIGISDPVVADGMLFASGGVMEILSGIELATGQLRWQTNPAESYSSPVLAEDTLIAGGSGTSLYGLDPATGQKRWQSHALGDLYPGGSAYEAGTLYVPGQNDLIAVDTQTGELRWSVDLHNGINHVVRPVMAGRLVCATSYLELYAVDSDNGAVQWTGMNMAAKAFRNDTLFASSAVGSGLPGKTIFALEPETGEERWRMTTDLGLGDLAVNGDATFVCGNDYTQVTGGTLFAIHAATGEELWRFAPGSAVTSPVILNDIVIVFCGSGGFEEGQLVALDGTTGEEQWRLATPGRIHSPIVVDGLIILRGRYMTAFGNI